ncbi:hypothetical protein FAGAP_343 [Fusarium agapanthi]|uniref:Uncharacterized protein n=1 Tax=Fusarium agapanthi TaxID=1803897 RepID=A0A9P5EB69_9HYPO|nr:hypothetical protein FAGAP_343 [Fusarium agapanthi]
MVFSPSLTALSPEATRVMYGVINEIGLTGAPIEMAGPYVCTGGTLSSVYGMWIGFSPKGPDAVPGGYSIEFSVVGPYPPLEDGAEAPSSSTEAGTKITWTSVNFDRLSLEELKCAEGKLSKAESDNGNNEEIPGSRQCPRTSHDIIEDTSGSDICLLLIIKDEALELPRALQYPFWMETPDSTENSDNEILTTDGDEAYEQQEEVYSSWEEI